MYPYDPKAYDRNCILTTPKLTIEIENYILKMKTCSFTVRSVCFRTSPANALLHFSLEMRLEHTYHCVVFLSVHSSNSTLVLFCLVTLLNYRFQALQSHHPVLRSNVTVCLPLCLCLYVCHDLHQPYMSCVPVMSSPMPFHDLHACAVLPA